MPDEQVGDSYNHAVASYVQDRESDLPFRLITISNGDNQMDPINTAVVNGETAQANAADSSPI
ncbi:hypothetical protein V8C42DRAFT_72830 [Trichoderma barbatum]